MHDWMLNIRYEFITNIPKGLNPTFKEEIFMLKKVTFGADQELRHIWNKTGVERFFKVNNLNIDSSLKLTPISPNISEISIMNRFYDRFDGPKWIDFSEADYLSDNDDFLMFFLERCNRQRLQGGVVTL